MKKAMWMGLLASLVGALAAESARAAEEAPRPGAYIILVGVNDYADKQIKPRKHAEADAKALYDLFVNPKYLGVAKDHIQLLLGDQDAGRDSKPATKENILKAIDAVVKKAGKDDLVIFGFFGQAGPLGERTCLFGSDATVKDRAKNAVAAGDIEKELEHLKSQRFVTFLDIHFKGFDASKENVAEPNPLDLYKVFLGDDKKDDHQPLPGRVVFLATNGMRQSLDLEKHGLFAHALLAGLKGAADNEGYEPCGVVTIDGLTQYLDKQVPELVRANGKTREDKELRHHTLGSLSNHYVLTSNPAVAGKVKERLAKFAQMVKDQKLSPEIAEEGQRLLSRMPKLKAQQALRKNYTKFVDGGETVDAFRKGRDTILADMKLPRDEADAYGKKMMKAIDVLKDNYVKELNEGELVGWAVRGLYKALEEKKISDSIKNRLEKCKKLKEQELLALLSDVREGLGKREDLEKNKDVDISLQVMMHHLDPYTNYISPENVRGFQQNTNATFTGIGIQIRKDLARDELLVVTPLKGSPAYKAGLKAGDIITKITRKMDSTGKPLDPPEVIPTKGLLLSDAVEKILGEPGTQIDMTVEREGVAKPLEFTITRGAIQVETVMGHKRKANDEWEYVIDPENRICYLRLTQFSRNSFRDMRKVVANLSQKGGIKGFILDLRFNPGGLLQSAVDISDLFIDDGLVVSIRPRVGREHSFSGEHDGSFLDFPMVCLVNGGSASGSEIVSACLQDHKRAIIIGERSYGKGSVQNIMDFKPTGGQIKLTTASFWRPNGKNLNKSSTQGTEGEDWGVIPDKGFLIKLTKKERDDLAESQRDAEIIPRRDAPKKEAKPPFKDKQLETALEYLRGQIKMASKDQQKKAG